VPDEGDEVAAGTSVRGHDDYTRPEDRLHFRRFFQKYPGFETLFGTSWKASLLHPLERRDNLPPIFWTLANALAHESLVESFQLLALQRDIRPVIRDLKLPDEDEVVSLLRELEVFRVLRKKHESTVWKPKVEGAGGRSPDLGVPHQVGPLLLEILTVRQTKKDRVEAEVLDRLDRFINQMKDHHYLVSYTILAELPPRYLPRCCAFLRRVITNLRSRGVLEARCEFQIRRQPILRFEFKTIDHSKGFWAAKSHGMRLVTEGGRIKFKILDKLERFQFPRGRDEVKGYVIILEGIFADHDELVSAVLGQSAVVWRGVPGEHKGEAVRQPDGVVADPERGRLLLQEIDFIASMRPRGGMRLDVLGVLVNGDRNRVTPQGIEEMLRSDTPAPESVVTEALPSSGESAPELLPSNRSSDL
jgi:hypothetical protein